MSTGGSTRKQSKVSRASRVGSTAAATTSRASTAPTRANSIAAMPSAAQSTRNAASTNASCGCGSAGHNQVKTEVWDPFQFDCMTPGTQESAKDLLHTLNQQRQQSQGQSNGGNASCRANICRPQPPIPRPQPRVDSGESDSSSTDNGRRTAEFLYDMWCQQKLCDVVLCCSGDGSGGSKDDSILAHKVN